MKLKVNGLPLSKSPSSQSWSILISMEYDGFHVSESLYHGDSKPTNAKEFLSEFKNEFSDIESNGLFINKKRIQVKLARIICDAPAKSFVFGVKSHTEYSRCAKCSQEGYYVNGRVTFPEFNSTLRTNETFRNRIDEEYHRSPCPFEVLKIDLEKGVLWITCTWFAWV